MELVAELWEENIKVGYEICRDLRLQSLEWLTMGVT